MRKSFGKWDVPISNRIGVGLIVLVLTFLTYQLFQLFPSLYSTLYLNGIFQVIRILHDYTMGWLPIPSIYLILAAFIIYFFHNAFSSFKHFVGSLFAFLIWVVNCFYILWGFNYVQPSIYSVLDLQEVEIDSSYIRETFFKVSTQLDSLAQRPFEKPSSLALEKYIRSLQEPLINKMGIPTYGKVRIRSLWGGSLLHFRTSGIYIPHAMEGHIDRGLYYKQHPFTMAHEMAHGYGFTDESVCNFIAYLTCMKAEETALTYSATLAYWRYLAKYFRYFFPEEYKSFRMTLNLVILNDLDEIHRHIEKYKDLMPRSRDIIYDSYLKSHGVKSGIKSYDEMIKLIAAYNQKKE